MRKGQISNPWLYHDLEETGVNSKSPVRPIYYEVNDLNSFSTLLVNLLSLCYSYSCVWTHGVEVGDRRQGLKQVPHLGCKGKT